MFKFHCKGMFCFIVRLLINGITFVSGAMLCGLGFVCAMIVSFLDKVGVRALGDEDNLKVQSKKLVGTLL